MPHCEQNPLSLQLRVNLPLYLADCFNKLLQAFDGQIRRLYGYQDTVGAGKGVYSNHAKGRQYSHLDIIIALPHNFYVRPQYRFPAHDIHKGYLQTGKLNVSRH